MPSAGGTVMARYIIVDFTGVGTSETQRVIAPTPNMQFPDAALYGLAGDIVRKLMPESETHPAAILAHTLVRFGNIVGRDAFIKLEADRHHPNLFITLVGKSAKARKGTASGRLDEIFASIDPVWLDKCQHGGFGSGEGVIACIRDDQEVVKKVNDKVRIDTIVGVEDKRLLIREGEFSSVLSVCKRQGNLLSEILRNAWDGRRLENKVKTSPQTATDPHVSAICDITLHEVREKLCNSEQYNGFANRFLWLFVERTKLKALGGAHINWKPEIERMKLAVEHAQKMRRMYLNEAARKIWRSEYVKLQDADLDDVVQSMTGRIEAQIMRLALIYALLDLQAEISSAHLKAAMALCEYATRSVTYIFAQVLSTNQRKILDYLVGKDALMCHFREEVFKRNLSVEVIQRELSDLVDKGRIYFYFVPGEGDDRVYTLSPPLELPRVKSVG